MRRERGQIAVGLAVAFTSVLAAFALVFQSAMITREKSKLQQTTDYAALRAANVQRAVLNEVLIKLNDEIQKAYELAQVELLKDPCTVELHALRQDCTVIIRLAGYYTLGLQGSDVPEAPAPAGESADPSDGPNLCSACNHARDAYHKMVIGRFRAVQLRASVIIASYLKAGNQEAFEQVKRTFLSPENLPFSLLRYVRKQTGRNTSAPAILAAYERGTLSEYLDIRDTTGGDTISVIVPKAESKSFVFPRVQWWGQLTSGPPLPPCMCVIRGVREGGSLVGGKIVQHDDWDYPAHYLAVVYYWSPGSDELKKWQIFRRDPNRTSSFGRRISDTQTGDLALFDAGKGRERGDLPMMAMALAKPYGGEYPRAGSSFPPPANQGSIGADFTGVKLVGLADEAALDHFDLLELYRGLLQGDVTVPDTMGNPLRIRWTRKDFLH